MKANDNSERRVALSPVRVAASTVRLLRELSDALKLSQGATLDRAVQALAVAESFGAQHLKLTPTIKACADGGGEHSFDCEGFCNYCGNTLEQVAFGGEHLRLTKQQESIADSIVAPVRVNQRPSRRDSKRGKATLEVVQPLRRAHEENMRNMKRAINQPPKFEHPNANLLGSPTPVNITIPHDLIRMAREYPALDWNDVMRHAKEASNKTS